MSTPKPLVAPMPARWWRVGIAGPAADGTLVSTMNPAPRYSGCIHRVQATLGSVAVKLAKQEHRRKQCGGRT